MRNLQQHHVFYGPLRKKADKDGLTIYLCMDHHTGKRGVHFNKDLDIHYKQEAQKIWMHHYNKTVEEFIQAYGQNYL